MLVGMRERETTVDRLEQQLMSDELLIARLRARQLENLEQLDLVQAHTGDGCRNLSEWAAQKLDVSVVTARGLVRTMRRTQDKPHLREALASGEVSFDRVEALSKLEGEKDFFDHLDIAGVERVASDRVRITPDDESQMVRDQFLVMQPSLDESWWRIWGGLEGIAGAVIDQALAEKADALPDLPDGTRGSQANRRALALYELATGGESPQAQVTVFVDATHAIGSNGETGVRLEAGPRVGTQALSAILCDATTELTINTTDGVPMKYGRKSRTIPPRLRRAVLARNHGHCQISGCNSRYRVEVHHRTPWSEGGTTDPENLVAVCWYHHHIAIHQHGFTIHTTPKGRYELKHPDQRGPPDH